MVETGGVHGGHGQVEAVDAVSRLEVGHGALWAAGGGEGREGQLVVRGQPGMGHGQSLVVRGQPEVQGESEFRVERAQYQDKIIMNLV